MINLAKPDLSNKAIEKVIDVLRSGYLVQGKHVENFETKLSEYLNATYAIVVSSGTAALHLSLLALGIKKGDEIVLPAFTFPATANVVELVGAKPVFVDINLSDFCIDTTKITNAISKTTKAIIPVHEFGQPAKMDEIIKISDTYGLKIVEDAACALGAEYFSKKVGTFSDFGCYSFHPRKAITTGEGGLIITEDHRLAEKVKLLRNHGMKQIDGKIDFVAAGLNYRMTDFQAVLGSIQLEDITKNIEQRVQIAYEYNQALKTLKWIESPQKFENRKSVYQTFHVLVNGQDRDSLISYLKSMGVETNIGAQALPCLKFYKEKYKLKESDYKNSVRAYKQGLALPMGPHIKTKEIRHIHDALDSFIKKEDEYTL